jgi:hypothetical protein
MTLRPWMYLTPRSWAMRANRDNASPEESAFQLLGPQGGVSILIPISLLNPLTLITVIALQLMPVR